MPLTRLPATTAPAAVAEVLSTDPDAPMADVLLAHDFAARAPWTPLYGRPDISQETWGHWGRWLARRMAHDLSDAVYVEIASEEAQWLARTLGELAAMGSPESAALGAYLRQSIGGITVGSTAGATSRARARVWWRAQLATLLAEGQLGPVTAGEVTAAVLPWLEGRMNHPAGCAIWILPAVTAGLAAGTLTSDQAACFLDRGGADALDAIIPHERALLAVPAWRAAWWQYLRASQGIAQGSRFAESFRIHCSNGPVAWSTWAAPELESWWTWMIRTQCGEGGAHGRLIEALQTVVAQSPDGLWLAAQPGFHLALRPLFESNDPATREAGLRIVGRTPSTPDAPRADAPTRRRR